MLTDQPQHDGGWEEEEFDEEERKQISLYADQPTGVMAGIRGGYRSLARDMNTARDAIIAVPGEVMSSASATGAAKAVLKRAPTIIFRPAVGVSKAIGQTLMGATNSIDPHNMRRVEEVSMILLDLFIISTNHVTEIQEALNFHMRLACRSHYITNALSGEDGCKLRTRRHMTEPQYTGFIRTTISIPVFIPYPFSFLSWIRLFSPISLILHNKSALFLRSCYVSLLKKYDCAHTYDDRSAKKENGQSPDCVHE
jgi:hypothetical protein